MQGNRTSAMVHWGAAYGSNVGDVSKNKPYDSSVSRGKSSGGQSKVVFEAVSRLAQEGSVPPELARPMDVDSQPWATGSPPKRPSPQQVGEDPAARGIRTEPQLTVANFAIVMRRSPLPPRKRKLPSSRLRPTSKLSRITQGAAGRRVAFCFPWVPPAVRTKCWTPGWSLGSSRIRGPVFLRESSGTVELVCA